MASFVFHGVPEGHDVFRGGGDRYYESFYGMNDVYKGAKTVFVVEIRKDATGYCSYYSFIRPQNVVAHSGRNGSYFGMSLKIDGQYCTDVYSLFLLFNKIYGEKISGAIIQQTGNAEHFCVSSFADAESQLNNILQLAENQININFQNDFEKIDSSFTKQHASMLVYYNLNDVNSESFFFSTKVYGKVLISPEYSSKDAVISTLLSSEKKNQEQIVVYEKQITDLKKENVQLSSLKNQLATIKSENDSLVKQNQDIQKTVNSLRNTNAALEQQLKKCQQENEQLKNSSNIGKLVDRIEPSLIELLGVMRSLKPTHSSSNNNSRSRGGNTKSHMHSSYHYHEKTSVYLKYILIPVGIISVILILWFSLHAIIKKPSPKEPSETTTKDTVIPNVTTCLYPFQNIDVSELFSDLYDKVS